MFMLAFNSIAVLEVVAFMFIGKWALDFMATYSLREEFTEKDNLAVALSSTGYFVGIAIVCIAAASGESFDYIYGLIDVALYGCIGIALLLISKLINDRFILHTFSIRKELVDDKNAGTGAVVFGTTICSAFIIAGAISGQGGGVGSALLFFAIGQLVLILFSYVYQYITPFDIHAEIERDNVAAGVAFGGTLIAVGLLIFKGLAGDYVSMRQSMMQFFVYSALGFILLPCVRFLFTRFFVRGVNLDREISEDQNVGIAVLEASTSITVAAAIYFIV